MTRATLRDQIQFRTAHTADGPALWTLARRCGLDENSPYAYLLWAEYFPATTVVAAVDEGDDGERPVGFVTAFRVPADPDSVFVWQIGVDQSHRGSGIAGRLLDELVAATDATHLEATVTPDNVASDALFRGLADRRGATVHTDEVFPAALFPDDGSGGHQPEIRYRIGPLCARRGVD